MNITVKEDAGNYTAFVNGREVNIPKPPSHYTFWTHWAASLSDAELEIITRVVYDRWMWETGSQEDSMLCKTLESEKDRRFSTTPKSLPRPHVTWCS